MPFRIGHLCELLENYLDTEQITEIYQAYLFSAEAHEGQHRASGEPYIFHPLSVARILAEMYMDHKSIIAAILHDVIEDTPTAKEQLSEKFGPEVAELVDGVSKLTHIKFESRAEAQAENFRKMMLAMVADIRVILIKLADRLHNMRTLSAMRPDKRRRIARETLDIYAPIANRLGMNKIRIELEDLGFKAMYPLRALIMEAHIKKACGNRKEIVGKLEDSLTTRLNEHQLTGKVIGRQKHLYGIYKKMQSKHLSFNEVMDVYAFRIIVDSVDMCYRVLGAAHNLYTPVPGKFKDYIAIPKANGYQSLHTVLFSQYGINIEVQIRTEEMDKVAENGIAAHWLYKSDTGESTQNSAQIRAREWLRGVLEIQQHAGNSMEFLENVKIDLFPDEVYVFTPSGDIMVLSRGATAVDFAYAVHTQVGNQCVAVKIDRRLMPLRTTLYTGQSIEIITAPGAHPNPTWLDFVKTAKARTNIRAFLKNMQHDESIVLGQRLIDRNLSAFDKQLSDIPESAKQKVTKEFKFDTFDHLLSDIGMGNHVPIMVARALIEAQGLPAKKRFGILKRSQPHTEPLTIRGTEGTVVSFARCCHPIPGDNILGFLSSGKGIVIHTQKCKNVSDARSKPEKWIEVEWEDNIERDFIADIRMYVHNQRGALAKIASTIAENNSNIENINITERDGTHSTITLSVDVKNRKHLSVVIKSLRAVDMVKRINRIG